MGQVLGARAKVEDGQKLGAGINGKREPLHLLMATQLGTEFVQLHVWEMEVAEGAFVQELSVLACPRQPPRDGRLTGAKDPRGRRRVESLSQRREDQSHLMGGCFQSVQGGVTTGT
jgi:hypothetical protein